MEIRKRTSKKSQRGTAELIAFQKTSGVFHEILSQPGLVTPIAWKLFQEGVISQPVRDDITNVMLSDSQRASKLLSAVEKAISSTHQNYPSMYKVFSEYHELGNAIKQMEERKNQIDGMQHKKRDRPMVYPNEMPQKNCICDKTFLAMLVVSMGLMSAVFFYWFFQLQSISQRESYYVYPELPKTAHQHGLPTESDTSAEYSKDLLSPPDPFVGRERSLELIMSDLRKKSISIIGIHGPPAFGKSALAIHVGHRLVSSEIYVRYIDVREFSLLKNQIAVKSVINTNTSNSSDIEMYESGELASLNEAECVSVRMSKLKNSKNLLKWAREIRTLTVLILDNCDDVLNKAQDDFKALVNDMVKLSLRNLKVIITSQIKVVFLDNFAEHYVPELNPHAAQKLLITLADKLTISEAKELSDLVGNCPLTLKVTARLLNHRNAFIPSLLIKTLRSDLKPVVSNTDFLEGERFMKIMHIAVQRLSSEEKFCLYYISYFPGSFSSNAVLNITSPHCAAYISILVDRSLLEEYSHMDTLRHSMHMLIKNYFQNFAENEISSAWSSDSEKKDYRFSPAFCCYYSSLAVSYALLLSQGNTNEAKQLWIIDRHNFDLLLDSILNQKAMLSFSELVTVFVAYKESVIEKHVLYRLLTRRFNWDFQSVCDTMGNSTCFDVFGHLILELLDFQSNLFGLPCSNSDVYKNWYGKDNMSQELEIFINETIKQDDCICTAGSVMIRFICLITLLVNFIINIPSFIREITECNFTNLLFFLSVLQISSWIVMFYILFNATKDFSKTEQSIIIKIHRFDLRVIIFQLVYMHMPMLKIHFISVVAQFEFIPYKTRVYLLFKLEKHGHTHGLDYDKLLQGEVKLHCRPQLPNIERDCFNFSARVSFFIVLFILKFIASPLCFEYASLTIYFLVAFWFILGVISSVLILNMLLFIVVLLIVEYDILVFVFLCVAIRLHIFELVLGLLINLFLF